jgi:DNA-binding response OmpR family regulator
MRVLIVEDEALVSMMLEDYLADLGHVVVASVPSIAEAFEVINTGNVEAAILDVNLSGENAYPISDYLTSKSIPHAFATGYGRLGVDVAYHGCPILQKPFDERTLEQVMNELVNVSILNVKAA